MGGLQRARGREWLDGRTVCSCVSRKQRHCTAALASVALVISVCESYQFCMRSSTIQLEALSGDACVSRKFIAMCTQVRNLAKYTQSTVRSSQPKCTWSIVSHSTLYIRSKGKVQPNTIYKVCMLYPWCRLSYQALLPLRRIRTTEVSWPAIALAVPFLFSVYSLWDFQRVEIKMAPFAKNIFHLDDCPHKICRCIVSTFSLLCIHCGIFNGSKSQWHLLQRPSFIWVTAFARPTVALSAFFLFSRSATGHANVHIVQCPMRNSWPKYMAREYPSFECKIYSCAARHASQAYRIPLTVYPKWSPSPKWVTTLTQ